MALCMLRAPPGGRRAPGERGQGAQVSTGAPRGGQSRACCQHRPLVSLLQRCKPQPAQLACSVLPSSPQQRAPLCLCCAGAVVVAACRLSRQPLHGLQAARHKQHPTRKGRQRCATRAHTVAQRLKAHRPNLDLPLLPLSCPSVVCPPCPASHQLLELVCCLQRAVKGALLNEAPPQRLLQGRHVPCSRRGSTQRG